MPPSYSNFDPLADVRKEMESAQRDIESARRRHARAQAPAAGEPAAQRRTRRPQAPAAEPRRGRA